MSNTWFRFKQFTIHQDSCAMKVGTDGVLLGAWTPLGEETKKILDMGTGTGLIALMLAQRINAQIIGVEKDANASAQAAENFARSPWKGRLISIFDCIENYALNNPMKFDLCTMNPPFFSNHLKARNESRSLARHSDENGVNKWLFSAEKLIKENGRISMIIPSIFAKEWISAANKKGLNVEHITEVRPKSDKPTSRVLVILSKRNCLKIEDSLIIETNIRGEYTPEFKALVKDFYL